MKTKTHFASSPASRFPSGVRAFTLIEIVLVVGIIGLMLTLGVPAFVRALHKEGMRKAQADLLEAFKEARGQAILTASPKEIDFNPQEGTFEVPGAFPQTKLPNDIAIDFLGVNFIQYEHEQSARVRFYPNGTSDDFVIVIHSITDGSFRKLTLDPVTALAEISTTR